MSRTLLLIGTRKGLFPARERRRPPRLEGARTALRELARLPRRPRSRVGRDLRRRRERVARVGRLAQHRPRRDLGAAPARASPTTAEGTRKVSKVSTLAVTDGKLLVGAEAPGIFESRDGGESFSLLTTLAGQPGSEAWDDPANQPPGHLGISAIMPDADDPSHFWTIVQGVGLFETGDGGKTWTPRNKGLRADWPRPHEEVGFCVHRLVRSPADPAGCTSRTTSACIEATTAATRGRRSPTACRASSASPRRRTRTTATRSTSSRSIPATPAACPTGRRPSGARATPARAGRS